MPETIFYRLHRSGLDDDGTVALSVSIYGDFSHSSGVMEVLPTAQDYSFWRWVVGQPRYAKVLDVRAVADARAEYDRFCAWRDGLSGATPGSAAGSASGDS
jgi:hypothetical protein